MGPSWAALGLLRRFKGQLDVNGIWKGLTRLGCHIDRWLMMQE